MGSVKLKFHRQIENRWKMHKMLALMLKNAKRPPRRHNRLQRNPPPKNNRPLPQPSQITRNNIPPQMQLTQA